jgi:hypothetical protein
MAFPTERSGNRMDRKKERKAMVILRNKELTEIDAKRETIV